MSTHAVKHPRDLQMDADRLLVERISDDCADHYCLSQELDVFADFGRHQKTPRGDENANAVLSKEDNWIWEECEA